MVSTQCFVILYLPSVVPVSLDIKTGDSLVVVTDIQMHDEKIDFQSDVKIYGQAASLALHSHFMKSLVLEFNSCDCDVT
jgi:hypothetical protein